MQLIMLSVDRKFHPLEFILAVNLLKYEICMPAGRYSYEIWILYSGLITLTVWRNKELTSIDMAILDSSTWRPPSRNKN